MEIRLHRNGLEEIIFMGEGKPPVFVFGSNLAGRHGKGAALHARLEYGAIRGQAEGIQGNSYAIPTKDANLKTLPIDKIREYVKTFLYVANLSPETEFYVTAIGCGLAGYNPEDIAPFFANAPGNVELCLEFRGWLDRQINDQRD